MLTPVSKLLMVIVILSIVVSGPAHAQSKQLEDMREQTQSLLFDQKDYHKAEKLALETLTLAEDEFGKEAPQTALDYNIIGKIYKKQNRNNDAISYYETSINIIYEFVGLQEDYIMPTLMELGDLYKAESRFTDAILMYKRVLYHHKKTLPPDDEKLFDDYTKIAASEAGLLQFNNAKRHYRQALIVVEKSKNPDQGLMALGLFNLAYSFNQLGRYQEAISMIKRALNIEEKLFGIDHIYTAASLASLANYYLNNAEYYKSEMISERLLLIYQNNPDTNTSKIATALNILAITYNQLGKTEEAIRLYKRILNIRKNAPKMDQLAFATNLNNLATSYEKIGKNKEAKSLYLRVLDIEMSILGPNHPDISTTLSNIGFLLSESGQNKKAEELFKRSIENTEKAYGPYHIKFATELSNLAVHNINLGLYEEALPLLKQALSIQKKTFGPDSSTISNTLTNLANIYSHTGKMDESLKLYKRVLGINEKAFGSKSSRVIQPHNRLSKSYYNASKYEKALFHAREATKILQQQSLSKQIKNKQLFLNNIQSIWMSNERHNDVNKKIINEIFKLSQLATLSNTSIDIAQLNGRSAAFQKQDTALIREFQNIQKRLKTLDRAVVKSFTTAQKDRDEAKDQKIQTELAELRQRHEDIKQTLETAFPEYLNLVSPKPLSISELQSLLSSDEAVISYVVDAGVTGITVIRKDVNIFHKIIIDKTKIAEMVKTLRQSLDSTDLTKDKKIHDLKFQDFPVFPTKIAYTLYKELFLPIIPTLSGVKNIFIVPDGPLKSLPLHILVTEPPAISPKSFEDYRTTPWLVKKYALTTLPSVSSFRILRHFSNMKPAPLPFLGIGDPILIGLPKDIKSNAPLELYDAPGIANADAVRLLFRPLPDTALELKDIAYSLGWKNSKLFLQEDATEQHVKNTKLDKYRILAFSTHGVMAKYFAEPALILTPPAISNRQDDGMLTASEITTLNLNAELVILSACNTAAGDGGFDAEPLSGLAKSFFFAGSRNLLVSHWPVGSISSALLTSEMIKKVSNDNTLSYGEGLQYSMLKLLFFRKIDYMAHPKSWAPFVVVGAGLVN